MSAEELEDLTNTVSFLRVDYQTSARWRYVVAQQRRASDPFAFPPRGTHLVARALADNFSFELREGQKNVQRQPSE